MTRKVLPRLAAIYRTLLPSNPTTTNTTTAAAAAAAPPVHQISPSTSPAFQASPNTPPTSASTPEPSGETNDVHAVYRQTIATARMLRRTAVTFAGPNPYSGLHFQRLCSWAPTYVDAGLFRADPKVLAYLREKRVEEERVRRKFEEERRRRGRRGSSIGMQMRGGLLLIGRRVAWSIFQGGIRGEYGKW
ncbi:MAG: hypothetical protein M1827_003682 [Pycnora praestabilis]|nr:MAG: hypothetical protein M1827_003682 [Pycnora praestabilis]